MSTSANSPLLSSQRLEGKVAVVTGGASGIGESIARLFRKHGAKVCVVDVQDGPGRRLCKSLGGEPHACFFHCDVTVEDDVHRAIDLIVEKHGTMDIMVNNAGIMGKLVPDIRKCSLDEFKRVFDVNFHGVFLGMKHAARVMVPQKKGSIVSASVIGGAAHHWYTGSKHAVLGLTRSVAVKLGSIWGTCELRIAIRSADGCHPTPLPSGYEQGRGEGVSGLHRRPRKLERREPACR